MDYKRNSRYFHSNDKWYYSGFPIFIVGSSLFACWVIYFDVIPYQAPIGMFLAIIGAATAFLPYVRCSKESEIDNAIQEISAAYSKEIDDRLSLKRELKKNVEPLTIGNYVYEKDLLMRRGRIDRRCRTSMYCISRIFCLNAGIIISQKTFSLIDETSNERMETFAFSDIDSVTVIKEPFLCNDQSKIQVSYFVIIKDNAELLRLPVKHDVAMDKLCTEINGMIKYSNCHSCC